MSLHKRPKNSGKFLEHTRLRNPRNHESPPENELPRVLHGPPHPTRIDDDAAAAALAIALAPMFADDPIPSGGGDFGGGGASGSW